MQLVSCSGGVAILLEKIPLLPQVQPVPNCTPGPAQSAATWNSRCPAGCPSNREGERHGSVTWPASAGMKMQPWIKRTTNSKTFVSILHEKNILPMMMQPTRVPAGHESDAHEKSHRECPGDGCGGAVSLSLSRRCVLSSLDPVHPDQG